MPPADSRGTSVVDRIRRARAPSTLSWIWLAVAACGSADDLRAVAAPDTGAMGDVGSLESIATGCQRELRARGVDFVTEPRPTEHPPGRQDLACLVEDPVLLQPVMRGVTLRPAQIDSAPTPLFASCGLALAIARAVDMFADRGVTEVVHFGTYGCRLIAGSEVLSEHGRGRAFDVAGVRVADGRTYMVLDHWERSQPSPATDAGRFLRHLVTSLFDSAVFNIVLTPDFNADHHDHFHLDLTPDARLFK